MAKFSNRRNLRPITLNIGTWAWVVVTLVILMVLVWIMQLRPSDLWSGIPTAPRFSQASVRGGTIASPYRVMVKS